MDQAEQGVKPTAETKAKAVEGVIGQLQRRKFLSPEQVQAAFEIEAAYRLITRSMEMALSHPERKEPSPPTDDYSPAESRLYFAYLRWVDKLDNTHERALYGLTIDICVEGRRLAETEKRYDLLPGLAKYDLRRSLGIYCRVNGRVI